MICSSRGSTSRLAKRVRSHVVRSMRWKVARRCRAKHISESNCTKPKTHQRRTTFGSCDVEKVHALVARSTFPSQNAESTPCSDHFWKLTCRKSAHCCGAKHISKSKVLKTDGLGAFLEVDISKKCTPLWRGKHISKSKVQNTEGYGALLDVRMSFCVAGTRDCAPCQKWAKREGFHYNRHYIIRHYATLHSNTTTTTTTLHYTTIH